MFAVVWLYTILIALVPRRYPFVAEKRPALRWAGLVACCRRSASAAFDSERE